MEALMLPAEAIGDLKDMEAQHLDVQQNRK